MKKNMTFTRTLACLLALVLVLGCTPVAVGAEEDVSMEAQVSFPKLDRLKEAANTARTAHDEAKQKYDDSKASYDYYLNLLESLEQEAQTAATEEEAEAIRSSSDYVNAYVEMQFYEPLAEDYEAEWLAAKEKMEAAEKALHDFTDLGTNPGISAWIHDFYVSYSSESYTPEPERLRVVYRDEESGEHALTMLRDYSYTFENDGKPGPAKVHFTGIGDWHGTLTVTYQIEKDYSIIWLDDDEQDYTGEPLEYCGYVYADGSEDGYELLYYADLDCTQPIDPDDVINAGTYYVVGVMPEDDYYRSETSYPVTFTINKAKSSIKLSAQSKTYTGKALKYSGKVTKTGSTGKVTYKYYSDANCKNEVKAADVKKAGTYYVRAKLAADTNYKGATSAAVKFTVKKAANPITVKAAAKTIKYSTVKKKAVTVAPLTVSKAQGTRTYKVDKWTTSKAKTYFTVNAKNGKVTAKKGTPKGTYKFQIKVTAKGNGNYSGKSKTVTVKIVVK